jgi:hypothetical protein
LLMDKCKVDRMKRGPSSKEVEVKTTRKRCAVRL